jgi:phosphate:Na+ symporter
MWWWSLTVAGVSLIAFIASLQVMRGGLEGFGRGRLPTILQAFAKTPSRGILTGTLVTGMLQSSAAVTAITVGLVAGENLTFRQALGIVLGANVGSTITPQLLTINLINLAVPCCVIGLLCLLSRRTVVHLAGRALAGFGGIVLALHMLTESLEPLSHSAWFAQMIESAGHNPLIGLCAGIATSAMVQSSTATTVITMALAQDGMIALPGAIAIIFGANIGTCLTSIIAAIGQTRAAGQVALAHVLLNVGGAALFLPFLAWFAELNRHLTSVPAAQVANAHTLFNLACTLFAWPVIGSFARVVERLLPEQRYT